MCVQTDRSDWPDWKTRQWDGSLLLGFDVYSFQLPFKYSNLLTAVLSLLFSFLTVFSLLFYYLHLPSPIVDLPSFLRCSSHLSTASSDLELASVRVLRALVVGLQSISFFFNLPSTSMLLITPQ